MKVKIYYFQVESGTFATHLNEGVGGRNGAMIVLVLGHLDVVLLIPSSAPRVLDQPVVVTILTAIFNNQSTMVKTVRCAVWLMVDTSGVELEGLLRSINGDRERANCSHSFHQSLLNALGNGNIRA